MSVIALIPAAGSGNRMQSAISKQYLTLGDRPILAHTLALFEAHPDIDDIFLITPDQDRDACRRDIVDRYGCGKVRGIVAGGAERQDSVRQGLEQCGGNAGDTILIHDGVRPLLPASDLSQVVACARQGRPCIIGVPVKETIKQVRDGCILGTPERATLWQAQTPQAFPFEVIQRAHRQAWAEGIRGTDDASLVERLGLSVAILQGSYSNIKITTPDDMILAQALWAAAAGATP